MRHEGSWHCQGGGTGGKGKEGSPSRERRAGLEAQSHGLLSQQAAFA